MLSKRNVFTTREEACQAGVNKLKVGEQNGMSEWGVSPANTRLCDLTEIWVDKWQLVGERV